MFSNLKLPARLRISGRLLSNGDLANLTWFEVGNLHHCSVIIGGSARAAELGGVRFHQPRFTLSFNQDWKTI
jgi:hypothetical protein